MSLNYDIYISRNNITIKPFNHVSYQISRNNFERNNDNYCIPHMHTGETDDEGASSKMAADTKQGISGFSLRTFCPSHDQNIKPCDR